MVFVGLPNDGIYTQRCVWEDGFRRSNGEKKAPVGHSYSCSGYCSPARQDKRSLNCGDEAYGRLSAKEYSFVHSSKANQAKQL